MTPKDWNLLVIAAAGGRDVSPVQLQKALFLLGKKLPLPPESRYDFEAYDYGPFCSAVYTDAEQLEREGLVVIEHGGSYRRYIATPEGREQADRLRARLEARARTYLGEVVAFVRRLSFKQLVEAIYAEFPEMRENSVYRG